MMKKRCRGMTTNPYPLLIDIVEAELRERVVKTLVNKRKRRVEVTMQPDSSIWLKVANTDKFYISLNYLEEVGVEGVVNQLRRTMC